MKRTAILLGAFGVLCLVGSLLLPVLTPVFAVGALGAGTVGYRRRTDDTVRRVGLFVFVLGALLAVAILLTWTVLAPQGGSLGVQAG